MTGEAYHATSLSRSAGLACGSDEPTLEVMRMPTVYLPHGGGPWPWVDVPFGSAGELAALRAYLVGLGTSIPRPKALLVIWGPGEEGSPTLMTSAPPPMFYDYYGFPPESYLIE